MKTLEREKTVESRYSFSIAREFREFVEEELLPNTNVSTDKFWNCLNVLITEFSFKNEELLNERVSLQEKIDDYHRIQSENSFDLENYKLFLKKIGYLEELKEKEFVIDPGEVDYEIANLCSPQLVVPLSNTRFVINACNARWGSLYGALHSSNMFENSRLSSRMKFGAISDYMLTETIKFGKRFLDNTFPLSTGSHFDVIEYRLHFGKLLAILKDGTCTGMKNSGQFIGYQGERESCCSILLENNSLKVEIDIDRTGRIGRTDSSGINDIVLESAGTTIMDCEDSVAAVSNGEKIAVYRNWLNLNLNRIHYDIPGESYTIRRKPNPDREFQRPDGTNIVLRSKSLLFVRNVGLLTKTNLVKDIEGNPIPEGLLDALITTTACMADDWQSNCYGNSKFRNVYIVKPKLHGSAEVKFSCEIFSRIEDLLDLRPNSIKMGLMDEERRTSINLRNCIWEARDRIVFVNTGFLDRTGDEIHTTRLAGPIPPKGRIKEQRWYTAYESNNVQIALDTGFTGRAQIGKGMWAEPDNLKGMVSVKDHQLLQGATTGWVPSPHAAVLHSLHYHDIDVFKVHSRIEFDTIDQLDLLLDIGDRAIYQDFSDSVIERELENNLQGILGYVVKWIDKGIGCSKVPDLNGVNLMEDRATLRISSAHIANWIEHKICTKEEVLKILKKMAYIVDEQNRNDPGYEPMSIELENSIAFKAACALVFESSSQPNAYTDLTLALFRALRHQPPAT